MANLVPVPLSMSAVPVAIYQEAAAFTGDHPQSSGGTLANVTAEHSVNKFSATDKAGLFYFNNAKPIMVLQAEFTFDIGSVTGHSHTPVDYSVYIVNLDTSGLPLDGRAGRADTRVLITSSNETATNNQRASVSLLGQSWRVILGTMQAIQVVAAPSTGSVVRGQVWGMYVNPAM